MTKKAITFLAVTLVTMTICSCGRDWYGDMFVKRELVTFLVQNDNGTPLENVELKSEELDAFDYDLILNGTHYDYTNADGIVTVKAVFDKEAGYSSLGERTTRFTFKATDYAVFDTIFNHWDGTVEIVLRRE